MAQRVLFSDLLRNTYRSIGNRLRLVRRREMDYVMLRLHGSYPERTVRQPRRFPLSLLPWPSPPPSVEAFHEALEWLAADPRVKGVVLLISGLSAEPATLASLRQAVSRFRQSGKRAIAYLQDFGMWPYYFATACDQIFVPESGGLPNAGLRSEAVFLRDTLSLVGIQADFEAIAEFKTAPDRFRRSEMTEPHREMLESLLESIYADVVGAIAEGRHLEAEQVQELLDAVPLSATEGQQAGLFDGLCYEDELPAHLGSVEKPATLLAWPVARRYLLRPRRWHSGRAVGVISVEGMIVSGPSRKPPFPLPLPLPMSAEQAGSETLSSQLRAAAKEKKLAAVVLYVDSPGGSSLASDLIWRDVQHLQQEKPVVVYMGNQAASGGYYISAPAAAIVAQPTTLTASIGIWGGKIVTRGLYEKLGARRQVVSRGKAAGLYADDAPFDEAERQKIRALLGEAYGRFKGRVAQGRGIDEEELEAIARGRVWTGAQALDLGLVDCLGDLQLAAQKARELAGVPRERTTPLVDLRAPRQYQVPLPAQGAAWLEGLQGLLREGVVALAPWQVHIRD